MDESRILPIEAAGRSDSGHKLWTHIPSLFKWARKYSAAKTGLSIKNSNFRQLSKLLVKRASKKKCEGFFGASFETFGFALDMHPPHGDRV